MYVCNNINIYMYTYVYIYIYVYIYVHDFTIFYAQYHSVPRLKQSAQSILAKMPSLYSRLSLRKEM